MAYEVIALDLDGTLTNSQKVITEPTRRGLIELQKSGKTVVLASGRPINGVVLSRRRAGASALRRIHPLL